MRVAGLQTFPVKGLRPLSLPRAELVAGGGLPADREWALLLGTAAEDWDAAHPERLFCDDHSAKYKFHQLINSPELQQIQVVSYDASNGARLKLTAPDGTTLDAQLSTTAGLTAMTHFFEEFLESNDRLRKQPGCEKGSLTICHAAVGSEHQFTNTGGLAGEHLLHVVCLPSVREFDRLRSVANEGRHVMPTDVARFRANILIDSDSTLQPFAEFAWCGRRLRIGNVELEVTEPTIRCATTHVNPLTAECDRTVSQELRDLLPAASFFDGNRCVPLCGPRSKGGYLGVYARVVLDGAVSVGDDVELLGSQTSLKMATLVAFAFVGLLCPWWTSRSQRLCLS